MLRIDTWRGLGTLVTDNSARRRLWLDGDGEVYDRLGPVTVRGEATLQELDDLLLVVAEWLSCIAEREGPVPFRNIHPHLRQHLYQLVPGGIAVSDDDEAELILPF